MVLRSVFTPGAGDAPGTFLPYRDSCLFLTDRRAAAAARILFANLHG
jgi:hypothetical protein